MRYITLLLAALFIFAPTYAAADGASGAMNNNQSGTNSSNTGSWYANWDTNDDGTLDKNEFITGYEDSGLFSEWDTNNDGVLDEDEVGAGLYGLLDHDHDGLLSQKDINDSVLLLGSITF